MLSLPTTVYSYADECTAAQHLEYAHTCSCDHRVACILHRPHPIVTLNPVRHGKKGNRGCGEHALSSFCLPTIETRG